MKIRGFYRWTAALAAGLMLSVSGITALAARVGTVRVNDVNVRSEAGTNSDRVCKLPANTQVDVVGEAQGNDGNVWYNISFNYEGADRTGYIRSDMLSVTETEDTPEEPEQEGQPESGAYVIQEPAEAYPGSEGLSQTSIQEGESSYTAWQVDAELTGGAELYLVYAAKADGGAGWYFYDPQEGSFQRDMGQFSGGSSEPEGLITSLQGEIASLKESSAKQLSQRLYVILGLGALCLILLILVIVFVVKYRNVAYEYYDEDEDDEDDEDYDYEDYGEEDDEDFEEKPKKRGFFSRRRDAEEEDPDDFDDFLEAVRRKQTEPEEEEVPEEKEDFSLTGLLPEIDTSIVLKVEEEARREKREEKIPKEISRPEEDLSEFDIEILDLEDWDLEDK